jgi:hypothetical protein
MMLFTASSTRRFMEPSMIHETLFETGFPRPVSHRCVGIPRFSHEILTRSRMEFQGTKKLWGQERGAIGRPSKAFPLCIDFLSYGGWRGAKSMNLMSNLRNVHEIKGRDVKARGIRGKLARLRPRVFASKMSTCTLIYQPDHMDNQSQSSQTSRRSREIGAIARHSPGGQVATISRDRKCSLQMCCTICLFRSVFQCSLII